MLQPITEDTFPMLSNHAPLYHQWTIPSSETLDHDGWSLAPVNVARVIHGRPQSAIAYKKPDLPFLDNMARDYVIGSVERPPLAFLKMELLPIRRFVYPHPVLPGHPTRLLVRTSQRELAHVGTGVMVLEVKPELE